MGEAELEMQPLFGAWDCGLGSQGRAGGSKGEFPPSSLFAFLFFFSSLLFYLDVAFGIKR